jgi:hypothetical protein
MAVGDPPPCPLPIVALRQPSHEALEAPQEREPIRVETHWLCRSGPDCPVRMACIPDLVPQGLDRQAVDQLDELPNHRFESFHQRPGLFERAASGEVFEV